MLSKINQPSPAVSAFSHLTARTSRFFLTTAFAAAPLFCALNAGAQNFTVTTLHAFSGADGVNPFDGLTQGPDGTFYGSCYGKYAAPTGGTIFRMKPDGTGFSVIHTFNNRGVTGTANPGGASPAWRPILATDGKLYGVTSEGGSTGYGVLFQMATNGANYTLLKQFDYNSAEYMLCGIEQGSDGALYGAGMSGGNNDSQLFKIKTDGTGYADLKFFNTANGGYAINTLLPAPDGNLYGVTGGEGDSSSGGVIFKLTTSGTYTLLHTLTTSEGFYPLGPLILGTDGMLYGTTSVRGQNGYGSVFKINPDGSGFTVIHHLASSNEGHYPIGRLLQARDGKLYGATLEGGTHNFGTIFRLNTDGTGYSVIYNFTGNVGPGGDHGYPNGSLIETSDGKIYGTTGDQNYNYDAPIGGGSVFTLGNVPAVTSVSAPANGSYRAGQTLSFTVNFSANVVVTGTPQLALTIGSATRNATYASGSGSNALVFTYTVQNGDTDNDGITSPANIALNGGTINDGTGTPASLTFTAPNTSAVLVDTTAPTITIATPSASLASGGPVTYTVTYADANFNSSTLSAANLTLNSTGTANGTLAVSGSGLTRTVTISGITGNGTLGISIAAGTASDNAGNLAPSAGPSATFTVDNTAPTITISAPSVAVATSSSTVSFTVTYSDANFAASTLASGNITLNAVGTATGTVSVSGTGTTRTVTLTNPTGKGTLSVSLAAGTATDQAGNLAPAAGPSQKVIIANGPTTLKYTQGANGKDQIAIDGIPGITYTMQSCTNLIAPAWTSVGTASTDGMGAGTFNYVRKAIPAEYFRAVFP